MGYNIAIGEAVFRGSKEEAYLSVWADSEVHDAAPSFPNDELTGQSNERSPSYIGWADFCRETGLYGMFFGLNGRRNPYMEGDPNCHRDQPIMADHPGYAAINNEDAFAVKQALEQHILKHGELNPGFTNWAASEADTPTNALQCATRARLIWLDYWVRWAVENCAHPVIANS